MSSASPVYTTSEVTLAVAAAAAIQVVFFVVLMAAGHARGQIQAKEVATPEPEPIRVAPVLDDLPLLKLGGKKVRAKLPDMWKKQAPIQRFEAASAPSPDADKTPEGIPESPLALGDAQAPPPDAEIAKEVDELLEAGSDAAPPNTDEEGAADGVKEGTETDPLKARAVSLYMRKILAYFNARFRPPAGEIPCEELKTLSASVVASVGGDRTVTGYSIVRPSGNGVFDAKVRSTMDGIVGNQLPPPPPLYPDIIGSSVRPTFSGKEHCK